MIERQVGLSLVAVALMVVAAGCRSREDRWADLQDQGLAAHQEGRYGEAEEMFRRALDEAEGFGEQDGRLARTLNNVAEVYPEAVTVEYHVEGSAPELGGLDWRSLRLVFERVEDTWYLVGVVHDEWTI